MNRMSGSSLYALAVSRATGSTSWTPYIVWKNSGKKRPARP